jgi:tetratricopeptide (TPR) repeat protein
VERANTDLIGGISGAAFILAFFLFLIFIPVYALRTGRLPSRYGSATLRAENPRIFLFGLLLHIGLAGMCGYFIVSMGLDAWRSRSESQCNEPNAASHPQEALSACNHLVERLQPTKGPALANAFWTRGNVRDALNDLPGAIADYTQALRIMPNSKPLLENRAREYLREHAAQQAIADYSRLIELNPRDVSAYENRGYTYERFLEHKDQAIRDYSAAIAIKPNDSMALARRGLCYGRAGDYQHAVADLSAVIHLRPNDAAAYYFRSVGYRGMGDEDHAASDRATAERLNPKVVAQIRANPSAV